MKYKNILVTGGAGFVGSNIAIKLKEHFPQIKVTSLDNLSRPGSELTLSRLKKNGVFFQHGDVRKREDLSMEKIDLIIECSAEPSVLAGVTTSPQYLINTNLLGAIHCFELARKHQADIVFLSTSRVYPVDKLNSLSYHETPTRFELDEMKEGISESFPLDGVRTLYGATKLSAELILREYIHNYHIHGIIDRFGVIAGPWQMGKIDQGFIALWVAHHVFKIPLKYIGFSGKGKQVRDVIHIDDVFDLLVLQISSIEKYSGSVYNAGGGKGNSISLLELTSLCRKIVKHDIAIGSEITTRPGDVRIYISNNSLLGWKPKKNLETIVDDTYRWIVDNKIMLERIFK